MASVDGPFARSVEGVGLVHLLICREYPPAAYPPGGIGTYAREISAALARAGERVHVIAHRWPGAPLTQEDRDGGRLTLHRVAMDDAPPDAALAGLPQSLLASSYPAQAFAWQAARLAEHLIETAGIDVVEAQEWEAPLYHLLLRRAAGLGPARRPPCVVHVHSPSARIFAANQWDTTVADFAPAAAMEAFTLTHADAVLCPSRFIADQAIADYALDPTTVTVIPYPRPETPLVTRDDRTWQAGTFCHVGRLEPRKGVLEWAEAIARVAPSAPEARFEFVGGDTPMAVTGGRTVRQEMLARLPRSARRRVRFHGTTDAAGVARLLGTASMAVVPSRWENFPFSCIEAMSTGVPVLVSPHGGMCELVDDGVSGWIAADTTPGALAEAALRALATSGARRREMGAAAAETVRRVCDPEAIVARHLAFRQTLVTAAANRVAGHTPAGTTPVAAGAAAAVPAAFGVVIEGGSAAATSATVASVQRTGVPVSHIRVVVEAGSTGAASGAAAAPVATFAAAVSDLRRALAGEGALAVITAGLVVDGAGLSTAAAWLARDRRLGLVVPWLRDASDGNSIAVADRADVPYRDADGAVAPLVIVRAQAVPVEAPASRRALCEHVVAMGFAARPVPVVGAARPDAPPVPVRHFSAMAIAVQRMHMPVLAWLRSASPDARRRFFVDGLRSPARSAQWLAGRAAGVLRRSGPSAASATAPATRPANRR